MSGPVPPTPPGPMTPPSAAIVVGTYRHPSQTFVNRHVDHLFGGRTCVIAGDRRDDPGDRPVFDRQGFRGPLLWRAGRPVAAAALHLGRGTGRIPWGAERAAIADFLHATGATVVLSEFGSKAIHVSTIARELSLPCFTYFRGSDASSELRKARRRRSYRAMMPDLAGVISVSRFLLDNLAAEGIEHPNAHVIPSGVDTRRFAPARKVPASFLAVGRMVEKKAPDITLRAFARATHDRPDATLRFIGDGALLDPTRALARDLGVADRVRFDGARNHDTVREALAVSEFLVQHSVTARDGNTEGLPTAIQEAMASGCVTIATRHAGIPEAIDDGVTGWLGPERDEDAFAALIRRALATEVAPMGRAARAVACERFDNARLLARLEDVLQGSPG